MKTLKTAILVSLLAIGSNAVADLNTGLVAYYNFDDCKANDNSGTGNNGTINGNTQCAAGIKGKSLSFNGSTDYVYIPHSESLNITEQISYGAWVKLKDVTGFTDNDIILNKEGIPYELAIHDNTGSITCFPDSIPTYDFSFYVEVGHENHECGWADGGKKVEKNLWTFLFITYDGSQVKTYFNGSLVSTYYAGGYISSTYEPLLIGARGGSGEAGAFFNGLIDEVRIYNRVLNDNEIKELYASNVSLLSDGNISGNSKGDVSWTFFGDVLDSYVGITAYMNDLAMTGKYQCTELAFRFAKDALHISKPKKPNGNKFAESNDGKIGYIEISGNKVNITTKYYPSGSKNPPINGSIISQNSPSLPKVGHVSIAKKVVKIDDNTLDVYLFEQNWIWTSGSTIAHSRKMTFIKDSNGNWTGKAKSSKAIGWLNPEVK